MNPVDHALAALPQTMDPFDRARAHAMLIAYAAIWDSVSCEVLGVEREFVAPFVRPDGTEDPNWLLAGKLDLVLRIGGRTVIYDHKTSSEDVSPGGTFRARLALNAQATHYLIGARHIGIEAEAFCFDVLGKPGIEPKLATPVEERRYVTDKKTKQQRLDARQRDRDETPVEFFTRCCAAVADNPERYFAQIEVVRNAAEIEAYRRELLVDSTLMDTVRSYGLVSKNEGACFQYGGKPCAYHAACSGTGSIDDARLFVRRRPHEELEAPVPEGRRLLTVSRRSSFNSCRQRHDYRYERGIAPVERNAVLSFGTAVHSAAEHYWLARARSD